MGHPHNIKKSAELLLIDPHHQVHCLYHIERNCQNTLIGIFTDWDSLHKCAHDYCKTHPEVKPNWVREGDMNYLDVEDFPINQLFRGL